MTGVKSQCHNILALLSALLTLSAPDAGFRNNFSGYYSGPSPRCHSEYLFGVPQDKLRDEESRPTIGRHYRDSSLPAVAQNDMTK